MSSISIKREIEKFYKEHVLIKKKKKLHKEEADINPKTAFYRWVGKNPTIIENIKIQRELGIKEYCYLQNWAKGGYINCNEEYTNELLEGAFVGIDLHSSYPAYWLNKIPFGKRLSKKPKGSSVCLYKIDFEYIKQIDEKYPPMLTLYDFIPCKSNSFVYVHKLTNKTLFLTDIEWESMKKWCEYKVKNIEICGYYKTKVYLNKEAHEMYNSRKDDKTAKIASVVSSGYLNISPFKKKENGERFLTTIKERASIIYPPLYIWTTAHTRILIRDMIMKVIDAGGKWFNTATDSVYFEIEEGYNYELNDKKVVLNGVKICDVGKNMGDWDYVFEPQFCKLYLFNSNSYKFESMDGKTLKIACGFWKSNLINNVCPILKNKYLAHQFQSLFEIIPIEKFSELEIVKDVLKYYVIYYYNHPTVPEERRNVV